MKMEQFTISPEALKRIAPAIAILSGREFKDIYIQGTEIYQNVESFSTTGRFQVTLRFFRCEPAIVNVSVWESYDGNSIFSVDCLDVQLEDVISLIETMLPSLGIHYQALFENCKDDK